MKSRIKEQGSALHIVIIIVLVVAVLGLLGFVLWQNFMNKPADSQADNTSATSTQEEATDEESDTPAQPKLAIKEWNIGGDYSNGDVRLAYSLDGESMSFADSRLDGTDCEGAGGFVSRQTAGEPAVGNAYVDKGTVKEAYDQGGNASEFAPIAHVGEYYYTFMGPDIMCSEDETLQKQAGDAYAAGREVIKTLRAI